MMRLFRFVAALTIGAAALAIAVPTQAAPISGAMPAALTAAAKPDALLTEVQYRPRARRYSGYTRGNYYGGYRGNYYGGYRGGYYRDGGDGAAVAAGIFGGLLLGSVIANQPQYRGGGYCAQRFRSYDPASGTYLGYDGRRHSCP